MTRNAHTLTLADACHLLRRAGLGATPKMASTLEGKTRVQAVALLTATWTGKPSSAVVPALTAAPSQRGGDRMMKKAERQRQKQLGQKLRAWWFSELCTTRAPFGERMTLLWHNHFTSSLRKARHAPLMYHQNATLRRHAAGDFGQLLKQIARDPAMVLYLDNQSNRKATPNENFARELLELFTLGEGNYTEHDVKEAARAFTGFKVDRKTGTFRVRRRLQDKGDKTILGRTGAWTGDDVLTILLDQPQLARHIVARLWREFVTTPLSAATQSALTKHFESSRRNIRAVVRMILAHDDFWAPANRGTAIKSPADLIVGLVRAFGVEVSEYATLAKTSRRLGQDLFQPPNVKGWPGGTDWITANTLLARDGFLRKAVRSVPLFEANSWDALSPWLGVTGSNEELIARAETILLAAPPVGSIDRRNPRTWLKNLLADPSYQVM